MLDGHFLLKRFLGDTHFVMSLIVFGIALVSASDLCSGVLLLTKPWGATFGNFKVEWIWQGPIEVRAVFFWVCDHFRRQSLGVKDFGAQRWALKIIPGELSWWHSWPLVHSFISLGSSMYSLFFCFFFVFRTWWFSWEAVADWWTTVLVALGRLF